MSSQFYRLYLQIEKTQEVREDTAVHSSVHFFTGSGAMDLRFCLNQGHLCTGV